MIKMYFTKTGRPIKLYPKPTNSKRFKDLTGKTFGRLKVVKYLGRCYVSESFNNFWAVTCSCGAKDVVVQTSDLMSGRTRSCGCFNDEERSKRAFIHGHSKSNDGNYTPTYVSWTQMRRRCFDPKKHSFKNYGGRGITICDSWSQFENFLADMGERPPNMTLDRIDNDGNYEKTNCRWATRKEQGRNTRVNRNLTYNGRTQPAVVWAEEYGINFSTFRHRINKGKWSVKKALTTPVRNKSNK